MTTFTNWATHASPPSNTKASSLFPPPTVFAPRPKVDLVDAWILGLATLMIIVLAILCRPRPPS